MSKKKIVLIIFGAIALVMLCGFSLGEFDYYFSDPWSDNDERIHRDVKKYLKRKYNEEFVVNEIFCYPSFEFAAYGVSVSPKDDPEFAFAVAKGIKGKPNDNYVAILLKPQIKERFIEITDKYFDDYKYYLTLSPSIDKLGSFMEGYGKDTTFQDVIENRTRLGWFHSVYLYVNEKYDPQKHSSYFKELFYNCNNPSLVIYCVKPEYYYDVDYEKMSMGIDFESYSNDTWYTEKKDTFVPWDDYIKVLEKGEYYDFTKRQDE